MFRTHRSPAVPHAPGGAGGLRRLARITAPLTLVALGLSLVTATAPAPAAADEAEAAAFEHYVAIGDSFVAGPMVRAQMPLLGCMQSSVNYPKRLAEELGITEITDVSCSGARMTHLYEAQFSDTPPQLDVLRPETDLVTVGIAGNDFGFSEVLVECAKRSLTNPLGSPCADHYGDELDQRIDGLRGEVSGVYADIAERSPNATVLSVGYLQILPESRGCWPSTPISRGDVPFLDQAQTALNAMLKEEAEAQGAVFVDTLERGHDVCQGSDTRWVEGLIPEDGAPVHPNNLGMAATTDFVRSALGVPQP
ncbi:SGNH/GDSL hydrolase family protein [Nocardiopsis exhalans]|uniref:Lysophospholipase L1-like esterase n=2 Tax=Nocardiopsis TaxID=2013 RepID=A0A840WSU0_9ACTN|nr:MULTISPECIES: SGNH/GDSL hydrolase family protein [Nocardiopsis]MBB5494627.1 lysophospholipase L1-like esterase [Nocardiopsis metallicus]USY20932.1 SGNH/GDSL hydrolase family protein [Nocardiopsis exhalans]